MISFRKICAIFHFNSRLILIIFIQCPSQEPNQSELAAKTSDLAIESAKIDVADASTNEEEMTAAGGRFESVEECESA